MLNGAVMNEVMISMHQITQQPLLLKKDTAGHAKRSKNHINNRKLFNISHSVQDISKVQKNCFHTGIPSSISHKIYVFPNYEKI